MTKPASPLVALDARIHPAAAADRLDLLQTFVRVVETGSLSAAAVALNTTQPTVSRRLQQLERALGRRLLHRSTHGVKSSEDGERCYLRAKEVLADWSAFEADFQGHDAEPEGQLRVLVPHAFGQELLVGPLAEFLRRYPRVNVEWLLRDTLPDFVDEGVDCAILVGAAEAPQTVVVRVGEVPRIVVGAPALLAGRKRPANPAELASLPWLALRTFYHREVVLHHRRTGESRRLTLRPRFVTDNLYAVRTAARRGLGVGVVSAWAVAEDLARGDLVQLAPDWSASPLPLNVVYPYARHYAPKLRRFVETVRELMPAALGDTVVRPRLARGRLAPEYRSTNVPTMRPV